MKSLLKKVIFRLVFLFVFMVFGISNVYASDWNSSNSLPDTEGNYKLTSDVTISSTWEVPNGTTTIDLNGHGIRMLEYGRTIYIMGDRTLNITDSNTSSTNYITLSNYRGVSASTTGVESALSNGNGVIKINGGYITGGNIYNGCCTPAGTGVYVEANAHFNMNAGAIIGNVAGSGQSGAGISNAGITTLSGTAKVIYNRTEDWGGAIANHGSGVLTIKDNAQVMYNYGQSGIHQCGKLNLSGAPQIYDNVATANGKGIRVEEKIDVIGALSGAKISVILNDNGIHDGGTKKGALTNDSEFITDATASQFVSENSSYLILKENSQLWIYEGAKVIYDANSGSGTTTDSNSPYLKNTENPKTVTVINSSFTAPSGKSFLKWNTKADGTGTSYNVGDTFSITNDTVLYAIWQTKPGEVEKKETDTFIGNVSISNTSTELEEIISITDEESSAIANGKNMFIYVDLSDISETVSSEEQALVEKELKDKSKVAMYLDIKLFKQIEGENQVNIEETNDKIKISFEIPESLRKTNREFYIVMIHNGVATKISPIIDGNILTFETNKFSTYALAYTDATEETTSSSKATISNINNPKTGDDIMFYISMLGLSIIGLAGAGLYSRKKKFN